MALLEAYIVYVICVILIAMYKVMSHPKHVVKPQSCNSMSHYREGMIKATSCFF